MLHAALHNLRMSFPMRPRFPFSQPHSLSSLLPRESLGGRETSTMLCQFLSIALVQANKLDVQYRNSDLFQRHAVGEQGR